MAVGGERLRLSPLSSVRKTHPRGGTWERVTPPGPPETGTGAGVKRAASVGGAAVGDQGQQAPVAAGTPTGEAGELLASLVPPVNHVVCSSVSPSCSLTRASGPIKSGGGVPGQGPSVGSAVGTDPERRPHAHRTDSPPGRSPVAGLTRACLGDPRLGGGWWLT